MARPHVPARRRRAYTSGVSAVARQIEDEDRDRQRRMTSAERLAEALALGSAAITQYSAAHGVDAEEARRRLERAAQAGRRFSRVMRDII
jgi:hypothetical protein